MTDYRKIEIGDIVPAPEARGIWAEPWPPAWFIFTTPPRGELPASAWMERNGVAETWYPSEQAFKRNRYKPNARIPYLRPIVPGYLFAVLSFRPHWDVLFSRSRGKLLKVVSKNGNPIAIPESVISEMEQVPQRLEIIREAERAKRTIGKGDKAEVMIAGTSWTVEVESIHAGVASFVLPFFGGKIANAPLHEMKKVVKL